MPHPLPGRDGEHWRWTWRWTARADAERLLIVSSGCHGVEGYCGSGVQVSALHDAEWRDKARAAGVAVLYVHALNPYGFSHGRRVTQENVDLNRNFQPTSREPLPANAAYTRDCMRCCCRRTGRRTPTTSAALARWIATHGAAAFQAAVTRGQYEFADGLFFGGNAPTWSHQHAARRCCASTRAGRGEIGWIDLHTGLGPSGIGERIFGAAMMRRAGARQRWWGDAGDLDRRRLLGVGQINRADGQAAYQECPQARSHEHRARVRHAAAAGCACGAAGRALAATAIRSQPAPRLADTHQTAMCKTRSTSTPTPGGAKSSARRARRCSRRWTA